MPNDNLSPDKLSELIVSSDNLSELIVSSDNLSELIVSFDKLSVGGDRGGQGRRADAHAYAGSAQTFIFF